jgi:hypothetical protein
MVAQLERMALVENHGLIYLLLGWEHLVACAVSNYLMANVHLQAPHRWPYLIPWVVWASVALATVWLVRRRAAEDTSPLGAINYRVWATFFLLCGNVVVLNLLAGVPVFVFLPVLATLSSFAFSVLAWVVSRRFLAASLVMFLTGPWIALFPAYGFLIYGCAWFLVLQTLGICLLRKNHDARRILPLVGKYQGDKVGWVGDRK